MEGIADTITLLLLITLKTSCYLLFQQYLLWISIINTFKERVTPKPLSYFSFIFYQLFASSVSIGTKRTALPLGFRSDFIVIIFTPSTKHFLQFLYKYGWGKKLTQKITSLFEPVCSNFIQYYYEGSSIKAWKRKASISGIPLLVLFIIPSH